MKESVTRRLPAMVVEVIDPVDRRAIMNAPETRWYRDQGFSLQELGAKIVHPPEEGTWAPGYYSVLFEDPDGIRLEMNHVPGPGLLADGTSMKPGAYR